MKSYLFLMATVLTVASGCQTDEVVDPNATTTTFDPPADVQPIAQNPAIDLDGPSQFKEGPISQMPGDWIRGIPGVEFPTIYFAYDTDRLGQSEMYKIEQIASYLKQNNAVGVIIEGHSDERGTEEYNRSLGERRALAVKSYFQSLGISDVRFRTQSFGEEKPAVQGSGETAWMKNRRAELIPAQIVQ